MGAQIAQVVSYAGLPVVMTDVSAEIAQRGIETVRRIYQARVDRGKMTPEQTRGENAAGHVRQARSRRSKTWIS